MNEYSHLSLIELRRFIRAEPNNLAALREWFARTQYVTQQMVREATYAAA